MQQLLDTPNNHRAPFDESTITTEIVWLTPDEAALLLQECDGPNRNSSSTQVARFRSDMENGRWHFEGAPIRFSIENKIQDGRHRLLALASSTRNISIPFLFVRGLDRDAQRYMDQGQGRTTGQQLGLEGVKDAPHFAAVTRCYLDWTRGRNPGGRSNTSKAEVMEWVLGHQDLLGLLSDTTYRQVDASVSAVGAFALAVMQMAPRRAVLFFEKITTGVGLGEGDPILALDRRLRSARKSGQRLQQRDILSMLIRVWNAWVLGERMFKVQVLPADSEIPQLISTHDI